MADKKEKPVEDIRRLQLERLTAATIALPEEDLRRYLKKPDTIAEATLTGTKIEAIGYKRCGKCGNIMKLYLFNRNNSAKDGCTGTCKECQRNSAKKSYTKTKKNRNYKKYYAEHKEEKKAHAKEYYVQNKEVCTERHKQYLQTNKGKAVMTKARSKRNKALSANGGIPYTRSQVIERDQLGGPLPICYLCSKPIELTDVHLDHMIGVVIGGLNCFSNVACTHNVCNLKKTKDCVEVTVAMTDEINKRTEDYIDAHIEDF